MTAVDFLPGFSLQTVGLARPALLPRSRLGGVGETGYERAAWLAGSNRQRTVWMYVPFSLANLPRNKSRLNGCASGHTAQSLGFGRCACLSVSPANNRCCHSQAVVTLVDYTTEPAPAPAHAKLASDQLRVKISSSA